MTGRGRTNADSVLAAAIGAGHAIVEAARLAKVSETTARRRMKDDAFKKLVAQHRTEAIGRSIGFLAEAATTAAGQLFKLAREAKSEMARLGACRSILEFAVKGVEMLDIVARLDAVERGLEEAQPTTNKQIFRHP